MASIHGRAVLARATRIRPSPRHRQPWSSKSRTLTYSHHLCSNDDFVRLNIDKTMLDSGEDLRPCNSSSGPHPEEDARKKSQSSKSTSLKDRLRKKSSDRPYGTDTETSLTSTSLKDRLRTKSSGRKGVAGTAAPARDPFDGYVLGHHRRKPMRTRFAPSPTGDMHLGSLRTALVNQVLAHATEGGEFVLRIEDTDQSRTVEDSQKRIVEDLKWLDLEWSEGPDVGGPHGPYLQSQRLHIYKPYVEKLIENGHAYRCFCSAEDLEKQKSAAHGAGQSTEYPGTCRHIPPEESSERASKSEPHVVRFKGDQFGILGFKDGVKGEFKKAKGEDDFVIWKTDGFPTYHLANVVDDHLMRITHVVRGDEWLVSTPKHLALYRALEWEPPVFAHLPLLFRQDGRKLSKRDQAASVQAYKETIVEPIALANWLAGISFQKHPVNSVTTIREMSRQVGMKLLSSNTKVSSTNVAHPLLERFTSHAYSKTLSDYEALRDQGRLETSEGEKIKEFLKQYWTPAIERIHQTIAQAEVAALFRRGLDADRKAESSQESPLVEPLSDLADAAVWTESVFNYLANICVELGSRGKKEGSEWIHKSISGMPWLFWRPTEASQQTWLAPSYLKRRDSISHLRLLQMLYDSGDDNVAWGRPSTDPLLIKDAVTQYAQDIGGGISTAPVSVVLSKLHKYNRLVLTGGSLRGPSAQTMLAVLGFDECRARLAMVEKLCQELGAGGRDLAVAWQSKVGSDLLACMLEQDTQLDTPASEEGTARHGVGENAGETLASREAIYQKAAGIPGEK